MIKKIKILIYVSLLSAISAYGDDMQTAIRFVKETGVNQNFSQLMLAASTHTQTYMNILCAVGENDGRNIVGTQISDVAIKNQSLWDKNLAEAWSSILSEDEMNSILSLKQNSPAAPKFKSSFPKVGQLMQTSSTDLLQKSLAEALGNAWHQIPNEKLAEASKGCKK